MDITFKECDASDALEARILAYATKLERIYDRITRCEVVVEPPRHRGSGFAVRIRLTVPGGEIVTRSASGDAYVAVHDAFVSLRRQLDEFAHQLRHEHRRVAV